MEKLRYISANFDSHSTFGHTTISVQLDNGGCGINVKGQAPLPEVIHAFETLVLLLKKRLEKNSRASERLDKTKTNKCPLWKP